MQTLFKDPLFDTDGHLRLERFSAGAREVMESVRDWLAELGRGMFLPIDLLIVLLEREGGELAHVVALGTDGVVQPTEVLARLRVLAREIEEENSIVEVPALKRASFSRGFTRILEEAWRQVDARGQEIIEEEDLLCAVSWRAEAVESASIRWAIRRLGEGKGDELFDGRGLLRMDAFDLASEGILNGAMKIAASHGTSFLGTPHLIAMLSSVKDSILWRSARNRGLDPGRLRDELIRLIGSKPDPIPEFLIGRKTLTPRMIRMLSYAVTSADKGRVSERHLVESFLADGGSSLELVQALGLESEIRQALGDPRVLAEAHPVEAAIQFAARRHPSPTLDLLGRDLTEEAMAGKLPPIVGREKELQRVFNILLRKEQRNPLLTGEAGVGKTALAVALAQHIAAGRAPSKLQGYRVIEINGANLMSGTSYRGDLEARIKGLIEEASREVILFIDEAHAVFAPRSGSNTPAEVPNHFKSALASGTIAVVGATTEAEYHRWFEQDPALKRRFERIEIPEPDRALVEHILGAVVEDLQAEYEVEVEAEAITAAIELSTRYLPEQRLPDKAKKLLMDACIAEANRFMSGEVSPEAAPNKVDRKGVAYQVHLKTGIPIDRLLRGEINWWVGIEDRLKSVVVGQDAAVSAVARTLVSSRLRNSSASRPLSVLLFVGPSGVGKATVAQELAREVFSDDRAIIRLDMTDYQEAHALSRLIGSPPGYVGYEDSDMLVTPLRRRPSSVVLLEDFDRAHPRIQDRILRFIEEGELADTRGHKADARNAVFVLTINVHGGQTAKTIGFGDRGAAGGLDVLGQVLDQDLVARLKAHVDGVIPFRDLAGGGNAPAVELLDRRIALFCSSMAAEYKIDVTIDATLRDELVARAASMAEARSVVNLANEFLYEPMTEMLLAGTHAAHVRMGWDADVRKVVCEA